MTDDLIARLHSHAKRPAGHDWIQSVREWVEEAIRNECEAADRIEQLQRERDALAAAMPSEGADAALAYAVEKSARERAEADAAAQKKRAEYHEQRHREVEAEVQRLTPTAEDKALARNWLQYWAHQLPGAAVLLRRYVLREK